MHFLANTGQAAVNWVGTVGIESIRVAIVCEWRSCNGVGRRYGAPLAGAAEPRRGAGIAESRCESGGNGPAHTQASKAVLCVDRIYRSKETAFPRKRC